MGFYGHGYGHSSWIFLVVVAAGIALRMISTRRRGPMGGRPRTRPGSSAGMPSFQDQSRTAPAAAPPRTGPTYTGVPAGWMADPSGKHEQRYWSGTEWTDHVMDGGTPGIEPLPNRAKRDEEDPSATSGGDAHFPGEPPAGEQPTEPD